MSVRRQPRRALQLVPKAKNAIAFDAGLDQACRAAADEVARELGRQAAREAIEAMKNGKARAS